MTKKRQQMQKTPSPTVTKAATGKKAPAKRTTPPANKSPPGSQQGSKKNSPNTSTCTPSKRLKLSPVQMKGAGEMVA